MYQAVLTACLVVANPCTQFEELTSEVRFENVHVCQEYGFQWLDRMEAEHPEREWLRAVLCRWVE